MCQNPLVSIYPQPISEIASLPGFSGYCHEGEDAFGKSASLICGSFIRFGLRVDRVTKRIEGIRYASNGCGFAVATAEILARELHGAGLIDLHGTDQIADLIQSKLGDFPPGRAHCSEIVIDALRAALANYREHVIEEFQGEKALICTCFGVTEATVVDLIDEYRVSDLSEFS